MAIKGKTDEGNCPDCGFKVDTFGFCSEFCMQASVDEIKAFKKLQPGEFGHYPCPGCGDFMEDIYAGDDSDMCSDCARNKRESTRRSLLTEVADLLGRKVSASDTEIDLLRRIRAELGLT